MLASLTVGNAFSKYERGEVIQSEGVDKLNACAYLLEERPVDVYRWLHEKTDLPNAVIK